MSFSTSYLLGLQISKEAAAGMGRMGGKSLGPGGKCVCPECGAEVAHTTGKPCTDVSCPKCGAKMGRKG